MQPVVSRARSPAAAGPSSFQPRIDAPLGWLYCARCRRLPSQHFGLVGWVGQETACLRGPRRPYSARSYSRSILLRNNDAGMHAANIQSRSGTRTYRAALCCAWCIATHPASHCLLLHRKFVPTIISTEEIDWRPCHDRIIST